MGEKETCEVCGKSFSSFEGKEQHKSAVHGGMNKSGKTKKGFKKWIIGFIVIFLFGYIIYWGVSGVSNEDEYCQNQPITEMNIGSHQNLLNHIHPTLEIIVDGVPRQIPSDIGVGIGIMRPIHTHDGSGEIHVEGPCVRDFTLGEFFTLWGEEFNENRIMEKTSEEGDIEFYVNGVESEMYENLVLKDNQKIKIEFKSF